MTEAAVAVFCGFRTGQRAVDMRSARQLGTLLAEHGLTLVYGGGGFGMMGGVADAVLAGGGRVIGVIPGYLQARGEAHDGFAAGRPNMVLEVVPDLATRKQRMVDLADGFMTLAGGFGTLDELFEVLSWRQLGVHDKPSVVVDVEGYYRPLFEMLDSAVRAGFLSDDARRTASRAETPQRALEELARHSPALRAALPA